MRFEIIGKNVSVTEAMKEQIKKKLSGLEKYLLVDENTLARVVARVYPKTQKIEVTIQSKVGILRAEVEHEDLYAAIDLAMDKLEGQIRKQKTRLNRRHKESLAEAFVDTETFSDQITPIKIKTIYADEMDLDEAVLQMELSGHSNFFIYTDEESKRLSVVYKRNDGQYAIIEVNQ